MKAAFVSILALLVLAIPSISVCAGSEYEEAIKTLRMSPLTGEATRTALRKLETLGDPRAVPELQKLLDDGKGNARVRRTLVRIEFKQLKTDEERMAFLRTSYRARGVVGEWASEEIWEQQKKTPRYAELFAEAAADSKHPRWAMAKAMLTDTERFHAKKQVPPSN